MKRVLKGFITILVIGGFIASYLPYTAIYSDAAAEIPWHRGASIYPIDSEDFKSTEFKQSLINLKNTGANYVSFILPYYQATKESSEIYTGKDTPSFESLVFAIDYAHSLGLKVMLKPHLEIEDGTWRAYIDAKNREVWFRNYSTLLTSLATIAESTGVETFCIGTELISMASYTSYTDNTDAWIDMITTLRGIYRGKLTYSANWGGNYFSEEVPHIAFWHYLDYIGISAYYPLAQESKNPTIDDVVASWNTWNVTKIKPLYEQYRIPILFTEVGYRSVDDAHQDPWDGTRDGEVNEGEQALLYDALLSYWYNQPHLEGIHMWNWNTHPEAGGAGNNHYTPQHKQAEYIMSKWFGGNLTSQSYSFVETKVLFPIKNMMLKGTHTFKAYLVNKESNSYTMYWQVDGGQRNEMPTSTEGAYKEAIVNVSSWTWKKSGPYRITFISKDIKGTTISQKTITVFVH